MTDSIFQLAQNVPANRFIGGPLIVIVLVIGGIGTLVCLMLIAGRKRREAIEAKLREIGFEAVIKPTKEQQQAAFPPSPALGKFLRHGPKNVQWFADGTLKSASGGAAGAGRNLPVRLVEHAYTIHTGKSSHTVYHTAAIVSAPASWAAVTLTPETVFSKIGKALGMKDIEVEDPAFNKAWKVASTDENFALALLSPEMQQALNERVKDLGSENWVAGQGIFALVLARQVKPEMLPAMLTRLARVIACLEPVLSEQLAQPSEVGR